MNASLESLEPPLAALTVAGDPAAATATVAPVQRVDRLLKGYDLDVRVPSSQVVAAARILDAAGFAIDAVTGVDWIAQQEMEVVYDYFHPTATLRVVVRARLPRAEPEVPTISEVFSGANWHERETHDFFGIRFLGHPNLKPFLLPEDADFHPLRKDYQP
jgi:NADH-quinone oxidoreductase subunit C